MAHFPNRNLNQTAVYWGNPQDNGTGGYTWNDPVEISCRWSEKTEVLQRNNNPDEQFISNAQVFVDQDVEEKGLLYLGSLDDLNSDEETNPEGVVGVFRIVRFDKIPTIKGNRYLRKAYL